MNDAFANDPTEWIDSDGDGYGDNIDACVNDSLSYLDSDGDGVCDFREVIGCQDAVACNYMELATDAGECEFASGCEICSGEQDGTGFIIDNDEDNDGYCNLGCGISPEEIVGCQDASACNYDASATDAGDCTYPSEAYLDCSEACLNDADEDGVCDEIEVVGCQEESACNYDTLATDAGDCTYPSADYLDCSEACLNDADGDGVCDEIEVVGCQDSTACNYMELATDLGPCNYSTDLDACATCSGEQDGSGVIVGNDEDGDGICDADEIFGCTEDWADNYSEEATENDYSCYKEGCTYIYASNYDPDANVEDGTCIFKVGCMDSEAFNYDADAQLDDGSCYPFIYGCTDENACNFIELTNDPHIDVNTDDVSCTYPSETYLDCSEACLNDADEDGVCDEIEVVGCQEESACNYDTLATDAGDCTLSIRGLFRLF